MLDYRTLGIILVVGAIVCGIMAGMHETHYRRRGTRIQRARFQGWAGTVDARLSALEAIIEGDHGL